MLSTQCLSINTIKNIWKNQTNTTILNFKFTTQLLWYYVKHLFQVFIVVFVFSCKMKVVWTHSSFFLKTQGEKYLFRKISWTITVGSKPNAEFRPLVWALASTFPPQVMQHVKLWCQMIYIYCFLSVPSPASELSHIYSGSRLNGFIWTQKLTPPPTPVQESWNLQSIRLWSGLDWTHMDHFHHTSSGSSSGSLWDLKNHPVSASRLRNSSGLDHLSLLLPSFSRPRYLYWWSDWSRMVELILSVAKQKSRDAPVLERSGSTFSPVWPQVDRTSAIIT